MILSHEKMTDHSRIPAAFCKTKKLGVSHRRVTDKPVTDSPGGGYRRKIQKQMQPFRSIRGKNIHGRLALAMLRFINRPTPQLLLGPLSQRIRYRTVAE
jgi:hypothetical protein